jgi:hypothetical protein
LIGDPGFQVFPLDVRQAGPATIPDRAVEVTPVVFPMDRGDRDGFFARQSWDVFGDVTFDRRLTAVGGGLHLEA